MSNNQYNKNHLENTTDNCVDFDYDYDIFNQVSINPKDFADSLKAINSYILKKATAIAWQIESLPDEERKAYLGHTQGKTWREIGRGLGISKDTVQARFHSANEKIRKFLANG